MLLEQILIGLAVVAVIVFFVWYVRRLSKNESRPTGVGGSGGGRSSGSGRPRRHD